MNAGWPRLLQEAKIVMRILNSSFYELFLKSSPYLSLAVLLQLYFLIGYKFSNQTFLLTKFVQTDFLTNNGITFPVHNN
jgi:hypothetical protein